MSFQRDLRKAKRIIRGWVRTHFDDQKLASVAAFNQDGRMSFMDPCSCLMGVTYSDRLHAGQSCSREHYWAARRIDLAQTLRFAFLPTARIGKVEKAYNFLGFTADFSSCFGDDRLRCRRLAALLRAEMHRRYRLNVVAPVPAPAVQRADPKRGLQPVA